MAKEILCGFGVDVDAVAGWLGSYGGEDSPDDISRGLFAGEVGSPAPAETVRAARHQDDVVHPGPLDRDVSGRDEGRGGGRARDRHPRLFAREPDRDDARAGNGGARQMHRAGDAAFRQAADRLCRAVVGVLDRHQRTVARTRHQIRPLADASRLTSRITCGSATAGPRSTIRSSRGNGWCRCSAARKPT